MQKMLLVIGKDKLYLFEDDERSYPIQYIKGNPYYEYNVNSIAKDIENLINELMEEFNLDTKAEISFRVIENYDELYTQAIKTPLMDFLTNSIPLKMLMLDVMRQLNKDKKLEIINYGVNFDGKNYKMLKGELLEDEFDLLAYTIKAENIVRFI